jgi:hypothetical protein
VGLALSLGVIIGAQATTTWTVCASGCNYTSIKAAIAASTARNGDTLAIDAGNYTEAGIGVNKSLTLQGAGAASTIVQAASTPSTASNRVFWILRGVTVTIRGLTIRYGLVRDSSYGYGGGRLNEGTLTLTNCTVSSNAAHYSSGGGLDNRGTLTLTNSTVSGNSADDGGGFFNSGRFNSQTRFTNSIIANHVSGGDCANSSGGTITSAGDNLDSDGSCNLTAPTDRPGVDPLLGPLQKNGGPTFTHALLPGSSAPSPTPASPPFVPHQCLPLQRCSWPGSRSAP